jgi:uncharacterized membrane protein
VTGRAVTYFGMRYVILMVQEWPGTILAVNVGAAVLPTLLSLYLMVKNRLYTQTLAGIVGVAAVVHWMAEPVQGVGIAVPNLYSSARSDRNCPALRETVSASPRLYHW